MEYFQTIGVIGHLGMVGGTVLRFYKNSDYKVFGYDLRSPRNKKKAFSADLIFICVPTPFSWKEKKYDDSIVKKTLTQVAPGKIVIIKSTIKIGTTDKFQKTFPKLKILFNPEFLSEATAENDFTNPDRQFVGYTKKSYGQAIKVLNSLPISAYDAIMPAKEAELLKYINNVHGAIEVIEANHFYEVCQKEGLDYDRVLKGTLASKWVGVPMGRNYRNVHLRNYRGYGGKCFPKDVNAWIEYCKEQGIDATLPKAVRKMNRRVLADQGYTEKQIEKK